MSCHSLRKCCKRLLRLLHGRSAADVSAAYAAPPFLVRIRIVLLDIKGGI